MSSYLSAGQLARLDQITSALREGLRELRDHMAHHLDTYDDPMVAGATFVRCLQSMEIDPEQLRSLLSVALLEQMKEL